MESFVLLLVLGSLLLVGFARLLVVLGSELFGVRDDLAGLLRYSLIISSTLLRYSKTDALSSFCSKKFIMAFSKSLESENKKYHIKFFDSLKNLNYTLYKGLIIIYNRRANIAIYI